jgi:CDP-diacylglycerol--glycerol-3-phosphate 3-phosphatidyltransferase
MSFFARPEIASLIAIVVLALISMPIYQAGRARRGVDKLEIADRGSFILGPFLRDWFYWFIRPIERISLALGMSPLSYNLIGVGFGVLAGWGFATGRHALGGWGVLLGGIADILDGRIARAQGVASQQGAFLDSSLDRFAELAAFVGLAVRFGGSPWGLAWVTAGLGGSLLVSYTRARGESLGIVCKLGIMQRAERLILLGFAGILDPAASALWPDLSWCYARGGSLLLPVLAVIALGTMGTAVFRTVWIAKRLPTAQPGR